MINEIREIWCNILNLDEIKPDEKFYLIGGNSIYWIMILDEVKNRYNLNLPTTDIYLFDTIRKMSDYIEKQLI